MDSALPTSPQAQPQPQSNSYGHVAKESETFGITSAEAPMIKEIGRESELPPEVVAAGVTIAPTTVVLPASVQSMGVKSVGNASPITPVISLPLTNDQISKGLSASIYSSMRWLAEWCKRRLKQFYA